jgi:hypothetical protein
MQSASAVPFGLTFLELATQEPSSVETVYDETADVSIIEVEGGKRIPVVESHGLLGTDTVTRAAGEPTDHDRQMSPRMFGTETVTEVASEATDEDPNSEEQRLLGSLGTETVTAAGGEPTDQDPDASASLSYSNPSLSGTDTKTKADRENTDKD